MRRDENGKNGAHRRCEVSRVRDGGSWNSREAQTQNKGNRKRNRGKRNNEREGERVREREIVERACGEDSRH